jgi:predicted transcriptional regulator
MERSPLGDQELALLQFVAEQAPISVGQAAKEFGGPRGLARTTILTVMERLRRKGYLTRSRGERPARYSPRLTQAEVMRGVVGDFVQKTLGGSLTPFVAYLSESPDLSEKELAALRRLVDELEARR